MSFTFLHTADWQIGKVFGGFAPDRAVFLAEARRSAIDRIAAVARAEGAEHVLVAGDVYDARDIPDVDLVQSLDRMRRAQDVVWHLLPGNHDPAHPGGIWDRLVRKGVPANVRLHLEPGVTTMAPDVALLTAPLKAKTAVADPTAWMDTAETPTARYRIGLAHGSIQGFGGEDGDAAVPISPGRAANAGLSYLALGDWHGLTRISDRVWYSGTPEPDRFPDNEPGFVLAVHLDGPEQAPRVERHVTSQYTWLKRSVDVTAEGSMQRFAEALLRETRNAEHVLVNLKVSGAPSLAGWAEAEEQMAMLAPRLFHLAVESSAVAVLPEAIELEEFGSGDLRRVTETLSRIAQDKASARAGAAALALRKLYQMAREMRVGGAS
jgi:DNA repair exonuclease SbcCD nuclease subunit